MPYELRLSTTIALPGDAFAQHEIMSKVKPVVTEFVEKLRLATGVDLDIESQIVRPAARKKASAEASPAAVSASPALVPAPELEPAKPARHPRAA